MTLLVPDASEIIMLSNFLNKTASEDLVLRLYSNNKTPAEADTEISYTEVAGGGYAAENLTASSWTITPGAPSDGAYPQVIFTFTGAVGNVFGYYITQTTSGKLMWAELFTN